MPLLVMFLVSLVAISQAITHSDPLLYFSGLIFPTILIIVLGYRIRTTAEGQIIEQFLGICLRSIYLDEIEKISATYFGGTKSSPFFVVGYKFEGKLYYKRFPYLSCRGLIDDIIESKRSIEIDKNVRKFISPQTRTKFGL